MSIRQHKKLSLLIEFSNSIFTNFIVKYVDTELAFKINLQGFFYFKLGIYLSSREKTNIFLGLHSLNPSPGIRHEPIAELTPTCVLQHSKTQSLFKKWTFVKLLG